ncbi:DHA2 family efflux MFS transporter permease subunit [Actinomadura welshii]
MTRGRYRWALAVVAVSAFMTTMDNTVVFTALPTIMADLDMSSSAKDWVATGYILMFSCLMIMGGRLADVYGCRLTFTTGMIVFTASSAVCGLAQSSDVLILARIVQGAGAALVLPATQVMVTVGRNDKQRSIGNIAFIGAASSATALGPTIGGVIVQHWHWGWIFLINIVPGILVTVLGLFVLTSKGENKHARIDLPGVLISATMLFAFIYGLESGNKHGWANPSVLSVFALGVIALVCFVLVESWAPDPMIDLRFFRNRVFTGGLMSQMLYGIGFNGMMFYSQPFLQRFLGFSPPEAGLVMLPPAIAIMILTPVAFLLATKIGPRPAIGAGMALMGLGMFLFSTLQTGDGYADLMPGVMLVGVGAALGMPLVMYVLKAVPERRAGVASGVINVIREASGAFGIAIVGLLIHTVPDEGAGPAELETFRDGTSSGLILGAALVLIGGVISALTLPSRRGWLGPKHGKKPPVIPDPGEAAPDLVPVGTGPASVDLTVAGVSPLNAAVPLPTWEDEAMPDRVPTPGPHWWTDTEPEPEPDDDAFTWRKEAAPWPPPPPAPPPANSWEDWPDDSVQRPTPPIPVTRSTRAPTETAPDGTPIPVHEPRDQKAPQSTGSRPGRQPAATPHADTTTTVPLGPRERRPTNGGATPHGNSATAPEPPEAERPLGEDDATKDHEAQPSTTTTPTPGEEPHGEDVATPHQETAAATPKASAPDADTAARQAERPTDRSPALLDDAEPSATTAPAPGEKPLGEDVATQHQETAAATPEASAPDADTAATARQARRPADRGPALRDDAKPATTTAGAATNDQPPGEGGVRQHRETARAAPEIAAAGGGTGEALTRLGGRPGAGGAGRALEGHGLRPFDEEEAEAEGRPAPPEGWYEPYVPEESPADEPQVRPRSDAW